MRADRLVSVVLLLRQRGLMTAPELAAELEVSTRTVLRDIEALSSAGVPVYAERGRHGGFALLPGFRTELTGLTHDEALALLAAGSGRAERAFGMGSALASSLRKVVDALPAGHRTAAAEAARRFLIEPEADLLARRAEPDAVDGQAMLAVRRAVLTGHKLRINYAAAGQEPAWRTVDPVGLVTVRGKGYLLAMRDGADRTYRLSRIRAAEELAALAERSSEVDLEQLWRQRSFAFRAGDDQLTVTVRVAKRRRDSLVATAVHLISESDEPDAWVRCELGFQDQRHALWALWQLDTDVIVESPTRLREELHARAAALADHHAHTASVENQ